MSEATQDRPVTVIGAGTIGLSWITLFLAHGRRVRVNSRRPDAEEVVARGVGLFAPTLPHGGADPRELMELLEFEPDVERAVRDAAVVVENAPEDLALKQELFARIGAAAPGDALFLSSSSTLLADEMSALMPDRSRLVVGHPLNPPHLVPLVEIVGGEATAPEAVAGAVAFFRSVGKTPVVLRKPITRFVANRLQSALLQESVHLVREGVVTVSELDEIVTQSVGLRWSVIGPFQAFHLGGGEGGLRQWLTRRGGGLEQSWRELGRPRMDDATIDALSSAAEEDFGDRSYAELAADRDAKQNAVLDALARFPH
ncbi:3-hydroxyacyl-CoA dehydrogenase NAD-binding domain-containing protein [Streptomyces olivoreticuli]|nr:3-hydroxyacyl-CoA dehydrogenase NAD-binding domain-containing protein [Streptomyces olivoreticuli]WKK27515.1 3-hydroxyacyl-CoA dehydrogenase NAD-binding domain-containing protein [Streptomyces olivoreticuli]